MAWPCCGRASPPRLAGLQLLLLLKREAQRGDKRVALIRHSQAVRATIEFCNLAAELGDPLVIPAAEAG